MIMENGSQLELCQDGGSYWWGGCVTSYNIFYVGYSHELGIMYNEVVLTLRREPGKLLYTILSYSNSKFWLF